MVETTNHAKRTNDSHDHQKHKLTTIISAHSLFKCINLIDGNIKLLIHFD